jgi:uncharacterized protein YhfF
MKQALRKFFIAAAGLTLLAACGGGSGDGGLTGDIPASESATITTQNAPVIAGAVAEVAMGQGIFSSIVTPDIPIAATAADDVVPPVLKPVISAAMKTAAPSQLYSMKAGREPCAISGTVDVTVNLSNPEQPSVDDRFEFLFTDCDDGTGVIVDGSMTITITSIGGDVASGNFVLGMEISFSAFAVTEGVETTSAEGTISIVVDTSQPPVTTISVSTNTFVTTSEGEQEILTSFTIEITEDASMFPVAVTVETSFTISSPRIGGEVTVTTSLALQSMGEEYPFVGELRIEGANQAVIVMIAVNANTVRLQIDVDGDAAVDETVDMTWDELMAVAG